MRNQKYGGKKKYFDSQKSQSRGMVQNITGAKCFVRGDRVMHCVIIGMIVAALVPKNGKLFGCLLIS